MCAAALFVPAFLFADGYAPQVVLGLATAVFVFIFARTSAIDSRQIVAAIIIATTGEVVLSLGWGLYTYQHALIPLYVPFGHGLFYLLAAESALQPALLRHEKAIAQSVLIVGSVIAAIGLVFMNDQWGLIWWIIAATILVRSRNQLLLSACFVYTMLLEYLGTAVGNWRWAAVVPGLGLHSANPPSGVGILYIVLDVVTVAVCSLLFTRPTPAPSIATD